MTEYAMTPDHPRWGEFVDRLEKSLPHMQNSCDHDHTHAVAVLHYMGFGFNFANNSLAYFTEHGGHCDCEVMFNIAVPAEEERRPVQGDDLDRLRDNTSE